MANTLEYVKIFETNLDKLAIQTLKTGFMDGNSGQVKYNGGNEIKIPSIALQGLGEYDREKGYTQGSIVLKYQTKTMTQDRGRSFLIDAMDVDETNFVATASNVMGEFQRTRVTPEIDAYRISKLAEIAMGVEEDAQAEYSYTINNSTIINKIKNGIKIIRENGFDSELVILANYDTTAAIEEAVLGKITSGTFSQGGINTKVPFIDDCPIISVPKARMYSAITLKDGSTGGQEDGGYEKGSSAKDINFMIVARETPIAVTKQDKMRIFSPEIYQKANAWSLDYRRYHDIWVKDNCKGSIFVNIKDAKA